MANLIPQSDTAITPLPGTAAGRRFAKTRYSNLVLDRVSGKYHARAKVGGKLIRKALHTGSIEAAKRRLDALLQDERARMNPERADVDGWKLGAVARSWLAKVEADPDLKPRAVDYRRETLGIVQATWQGFDALKPAAVSVGMCRMWAEPVRSRYSPSRFNGAVESLRGVFARAMDLGLCSSNPALGVERAGYQRKLKRLPSAEKFKAMLARLDTNPGARRAARVVRFLAYSGARPSAAARVMPEDVNRAKNILTLPPIKHQHAALEVPMSKDLRAVVDELLADHPGGELPLLPIRSPRKALATACRTAGVPVLTTYDLRHFFTTHLLEAGVPPPMVAALRGDKDGGAMLLKHYFHARPDGLARALKKVRF